MSDLKAMWGDPPKTNMWKVREHNQGSHNDYVAVVSHILKDNGELFVMRQREGGLWEMAYHNRFQKPMVIKRFSEAHDFMAMRDYFLSNECWLKHVKSFLLSHKQFFVGGASAKVASSTKVKGIKHRAMWGDPPKPNLWKVVSSWYAGGGEQFSYCSVESPILKEGSFFQLMFDTSSKLWEIRYSGSTSFSVHTFYNVHSFLEAQKIFLSRKGWDIIKTFASIAGTGFFRTKVASSNLRAQWGDPPKPNMWKVKTGSWGRGHDFVEINSPNLYGGAMSNITLTRSAKDVWEVSFNPYNEEHHVHLFESKTFEEARDRFLSPEGWSWIKGFMQVRGDIFSTKVASSNLKVQWGDPPKPNMWKTKVIYSPNPEKADQPIGLIISSAFDSSAFSISRWEGAWELSYQNRGKEVVSRHWTEDDFQSAVDFYLSPKGWDLVKLFKKRFPEKMTAKWKSMKIANDWLAPPTDIKLQWGDPPKPNMWRVTGNKLLGFVGKGEEGYMITSPMMVGSIFLTFKKGSYSKLEYIERGGEVVTLKYLDKHSLKLSVELMAHPMLWRNIIKPAIKSGTINLTVPKVASPRNQ